MEIEVVEIVEVKFITGKILINKTDDETGEVVPECLFRITNEAGEVVAEKKPKAKKPATKKKTTAKKTTTKKTTSSKTSKK